MIVTLGMYLTSDHIESYLVTNEPLADNKLYTALAVRDELIVTTPVSGNITYYARDNTKVAKAGPVFTIGDVSQTSEVDDFSENDYSRIRRSMADFSTVFKEENFSDTYNFKYQLEGMLLQYSGLAVNPDTGLLQLPEGQTLYGAHEDGVILYSLDGYENADGDNPENEMFMKKSVKPRDLHSNQQVEAGDPVYKLITNEKWSILIPVSSEEAVKIGERKKIMVKFLKDGNTQTGSVRVMKNDKNEFFIKITFLSGMIRYSSDRFLDIELVTNTKTGLKIPLSAIVEKEFYKIPKEFISYNGQEDAGFNKKIGRKGKDDTSEFISVPIYSSDDENVYIDTDDMKKGDVITKPDSQESYTIGPVEAFQGVFNMNKGYAVFRKIDIIDQNDEYCIVETGTKYGLRQFDHIVKDGSSVSDEEVLYK